MAGADWSFRQAGAGCPVARPRRLRGVGPTPRPAPGLLRVRPNVVLETSQRFALPVWFLIISVDRVVTAVAQGTVGIDLRIYRDAATLALNGGNPWSATPGGGNFAAPPPTLLFYLPTALVSLPVAMVATGVIGITSGLWIIRRLDLPWWWLLFPPLVESIVTGNADAPVLALVLLPGPAAGLGAGLKAYAAIPLLAQRRWRAIAVSLTVVALSLPLWPDFIASLEAVASSLDAQAVGLSAWATWAMVPAVGALYFLRRDGAEWLAVPVLWPYTQSHYATLAMPALKSSRLAAAIMSFAIPFAPVVAVVVLAAQVTLRGRADEDPGALLVGSECRSRLELAVRIRQAPAPRQPVASGPLVRRPPVPRRRSRSRPTLRCTRTSRSRWLRGGPPRCG